jgi:general secretion pathway protein D
MSHHRFVLLGLLGLSLHAWPGLAQAQAPAQPPQTGETIVVPPAYRQATIRLKASTEIDQVAQILAAAMNRSILVDPRIKGTLNLTPARGDGGGVPDEVEYKLPEAWRVFTATLRGLTFTVVDTGALLKVVPENEAKLHTGVVQVGAPQARGDQVVTQIFRLNHENPNNLLQVLRPLISPNNTINASPTSGTLVITDYADNVQRLAKIIAALDQPTASEIEVVPVQHAMATDLAPLVQKLLSISSTPGTPGGAANQSTATTVLADPRNNSLIVRSANPVRLNEAKMLIDKLDRVAPGGGPAGNIWVVYLKNSDAVRLAEVLRAALASGASAVSGTSGSGGALSGTSGTSNRAQASVAPSRGMDPNGAAGGMNTVATTPVSASAGPSTGGQIQADPSTNSLIISAPEPVYRQIRQVIEQLDTRRAQVRVESIIVKVDASKSAEFGVQWQTLLGNSSSSTGVYTGTNFGSGGNNLLNLTAAAAGGSSSTTSSSGLTLPGAGLNIGVLQKVLGTWTLGALARFLETNAGGNVLSTPEIVALDNEEAKIVVGQNVPFITGSYTSTGTGSGATNPFQTIERKDVGLTLRIKSQVGEGGTVRMTIYQENSSVSQSTTSGLITDKSSIETTVLVDDGSTLVLGGLMKDEYTDNNSSVPLLADIPLIGHLFRSTTRSHTKSNLMVFLRPTVIRDQLTSDRITLNRYDAIRAMQSTVQPQGREWLLPVDGVTPLPSLAPATAPAAPTAPASAPAPAPAIPAPAAQ